MRPALRPLRLPAFRRLALVRFVDELGDWLGEIALAVLVFDQTGSPLATAALFLALPVRAGAGDAAAGRPPRVAPQPRQPARPERRAGGGLRGPRAAVHRLLPAARDRAGGARRRPRRLRARADPRGGGDRADAARAAARGKRAAQHRLHGRRGGRTRAGRRGGRHRRAAHGAVRRRRLLRRRGASARHRLQPAPSQAGGRGMDHAAAEGAELRQLTPPAPAAARRPRRWPSSSSRS